MKQTIIVPLFFAFQLLAQPSYGQDGVSEHSHEGYVTFEKVEQELEDYVTFEMFEQELEKLPIIGQERSEILYFSAAANLLALFLGIITTLSVILGIATWYIKERLITRATEAADRKVNEIIEQKLEFARNYSAVNILHQVGYSLWEYDQDEFRDLVKERLINAFGCAKMAA